MSSNVSLIESDYRTQECLRQCLPTTSSSPRFHLRLGAELMNSAGTKGYFFEAAIASFASRLRLAVGAEVETTAARTSKSPRSCWLADRRLHWVSPPPYFDCSQSSTRSTDGRRSFSQPGHLNGNLFHAFGPMVECYLFCANDFRIGNAFDK